MSAKEYLKDLKRLDTMINQKIKELDDLKALREGVGGLDYSKDRVQTSMLGDASFVNSTLRIIELEREIAEDGKATISEMAEAMGVSEKSIKRYADDLKGNFTLKDNVIKRA